MTSTFGRKKGLYTVIQPAQNGSLCRDFDAEERFNVGAIATQENPECISGLVLQGVKKPYECHAFGTRCTPERPLGATMVSSEGACAAYYRYRKGKASVQKQERS